MASEVDAPNLNDAPKLAAVPNGSDAAKVQDSVIKWGREVSYAIRANQNAVAELRRALEQQNGVPSASGDSSSSQGGRGQVGPPGAPGAAGAAGAPGAAGAQGPTGGFTLFYNFSTSLTAPPGAGYVRYNNATFASISHLFVSTTDRNSASVAAILGALRVGSVIKIFQELSTLQFSTFQIVSITSASGYLNLAVLPLNGAVLDDLAPIGFAFAGMSGSMSDWFNVMDYGALGTASDDTAAINSAIADLNANGGGVLYFPSPPIVYIVSSELTPISVPCMVLGPGMRGPDNLFILGSGVSGAVMTVAFYNSVTIQGININGGGADSCLKITGDGTLAYNNKSFVSQCCFDNAGSKCLDLNVAEIRVSDCTWTSADYGCYITNSVNLDYGGGVFIGNNIEGTIAGVYALVDGLTFIGNKFQGGGHGLHWKHTDGLTLADIWFSSNHCEDGGSPIYFEGPATSGKLTRVIIVGNEFAPTPGTTCIDASSSAFGQWIQNLTIHGNSFSQFDIGINLYNVWNGTVSGNVGDAGGGNILINIDASCGANGFVSTKSNRVDGGATLLVNSAGWETDAVGNVPYMVKQSQTLTAVANNQLDFDISGAGFSAAASCGMIQIDDPSSTTILIHGGYESSSGSNTATNARFKVFGEGGANLPAGTFDFTIIVYP